jgi:nicotinamide riboside transporter PnuC
MDKGIDYLDSIQIISGLFLIFSLILSQNTEHISRFLGIVSNSIFLINVNRENTIATTI